MTVKKAATKSTVRRKRFYFSFTHKQESGLTKRSFLALHRPHAALEAMRVAEKSPGLVLDGFTMERLDASGLIIKGTIFKNVDFHYVRFNRTQFQNCKFENCRFFNCNFSHATLVTCRFSESMMSGCDFADSTWREVMTMDDRSYLENCRFTRAALVSVTFHGNLSNPNFTDATVNSCNFQSIYTGTFTNMKESYSYFHGKIDFAKDLYDAGWSDRGYRFIGIGRKDGSMLVRAGCRHFSLGDAFEHWHPFTSHWFKLISLCQQHEFAHPGAVLARIPAPYHILVSKKAFARHQDDILRSAVRIRPLAFFERPGNELAAITAREDIEAVIRKTRRKSAAQRWELIVRYTTNNGETTAWQDCGPMLFASREDAEDKANECNRQILLESHCVPFINTPPVKL